MLKLPFYDSDLVPAAPVKHCYQNVWIRDLYYIGLCSDEKTKKRIWKGMVSIADRYFWKLKHHAKVQPEHSFEFIHIRYSPEGKEIAEGWRHKQWDAIGNWLEVVIDEERYDLASLFVDYLSVIHFYKNPCATAWEDANVYDPYSLGACIVALQRAKRVLPEKRVLIDDMVKKATRRLYSLLPYGPKSRGVDLSMLGLIWPLDVAGPYRQDIIDLVKERLMREPFGFIRYDGDTYSGEFMDRGVGHEVPWLLGDVWMAKIEPENDLWRKRADDAYKHFGCMPEAFFPENLKPNRNTPLMWAESMYDSLSR